MIEFKAPAEVTCGSGPELFLAGTIEMGTATDWQAHVVNRLSDIPCTILNPRRDNWDSSWEQSINNPQFKEQVDWELDQMLGADYVLVYFDPNSRSPVSLLELGVLTAGKRYHTVVVCPEGFWRKGNVDIICDRFGIRQMDTLDEAVDCFRLKAKSWQY